MRHLISLGHRCDVAFQLRMHGPENTVHFFDWLATPADAVTAIIAADFDVFHPDHLALTTSHEPHFVRDTLLGVQFHHQFPLYKGHMQPDFLLHYEPFAKKFAHLAARFRDYLTSRPVTLVRQDITKPEALRLEEAVLSRFPGADVQFLYLLPKGDVFETPRGHARILPQDGSSLGDPLSWSDMLLEEGLITNPFRHATQDILGAAHDDYNLLVENRFSDAQLRAALNANPENPAFALELARHCMLQGRLAEAEEVVLIGLIRAPRHPQTMHLAALLQWKRGYLPAAEAAQAIVQAGTLMPHDASWLEDAAAACLAAGQPQQALAYASRDCAAHPVNHRRYLCKADCLLALQEFARAARAISTAASLGPIPQFYHHRHAKALAALGRLEDAVAAEQRALAMAETFDSLYHLASLLTDLGRQNEAIASLERALPLAGAEAGRVRDMIARLTPPPASSTDEIVKLVIWDLDETFWSGTLSEEGIKPIEANIAMVKTLTKRGIVNSICSKNDFATAKAALEGLGIWDYFVFPRIEFTPKGAVIRDLIETAQLRAPNVLFIDDNRMNLNEALHYSPGLQVAEPTVLAGLLDEKRCKGKPDPNHERLQRYKVLEQKLIDQGSSGKDNLEFLRQSKIRVSFHHDVLAEFPRIHDLVNRTNQLNFTKLRWPEDEAAARQHFISELAEVFDSHAGYIKVSDRYGNYGICGFYMTRLQAGRHFLFSCRAMNMGVEEFVWHKLKRPYVHYFTEGGGKSSQEPDWITVVEDADSAVDAGITETRQLVCVRGACDLMMMSHYLRLKFDTVEEFQYPYQGWAIHQQARVIALEKDLKSSEARALLAKIPGIPPQRFDSAVNSRAADIYVLSFSPEIFGGLKRSRSTGLLLPLSLEHVRDNQFNSMTYDELLAANKDAASISPEQWAFLQQEFEPAPYMDAALMAEDVTQLLSKLRGKIVIVLMLNETVGNRPWTLETFGRINAVVRPIAQSFGCHLIDMKDYVRGIADLADPQDPGVHYSRQVYMRLADRVIEICQPEVKETGMLAA